METLQSPFLFHELIKEILSRLPVKSLMRFKCVSKSWKSLITDPSFLKLHLQNLPKDTNNILLTISIGNDRCFVPCSMHSFTENPSSTVSEEGRYQFNGDYRVVGSCNGLVCLRGSFCKYPIRDYWVLFWNPATRFQSKRSPSLSLDDEVLVDFGFGYDNSSDTYKVVVVFRGSHETTLKVYNMGDNYWRKVLISIPVFHFSTFNGQSVSGTLNSIAALFKWHADPITIEQVVIFSVDIVKETYKQLLLPDDFKLDDKEYFCATRLGVLGGCLCFFHDYKSTHLIIWQMKEFGVEKSWTQLVYVSYQHLQIRHAWPFPLLPLCISENGDVVIRASQGLQAAILYNKRDNKVERTEMPNNKRCLDVKDYVESLVLPR